MSWDIFVQDFPPEAKKIKDIPRDFKPKDVIAKRSDVMRAIHAVAPHADFTDPTWGRIRGDGYSVEVDIDDKEDIDGFAFFVRGVNPEVVKIIADILDRLKLRAVETGTGEFFEFKTALRGFALWQAYRNQIIDGGHLGRKRSGKSKTKARAKAKKGQGKN